MTTEWWSDRWSWYVLLHRDRAPGERDHPPLRVLILRGEGNAFCSGYDFKDQTMSKAPKYRRRSIEVT